MNKKKEKGKTLLIFFLILAIIVICVLSYLLYKFWLENQVANNEIIVLNSKVSELEKRVSKYQEVFEKGEETVEEIEKTATEIEKAVTETQTISTKNLAGKFKSDTDKSVTWQFDGLGQAYYFAETYEKIGTYTIENNEVKINFTSKMIYSENDKNGDNKGHTINENETLEYVSQDTLKDKNGNKLTKFE